MEYAVYPKPQPGRYTNWGAGVSKRRRLRIYERDGFRCLHCSTTEDLTIDHIVPRRRGGTNDESNLQTLCRRCNSSKGAKV